MIILRTADHPFASTRRCDQLGDAQWSIEVGTEDGTVRLEMGEISASHLLAMAALGADDVRLNLDGGDVLRIDVKKADALTMTSAGGFRQ